MSDLKEEEACLSMRSDRSIVEPPFFSNEPGPSGTKVQYRRAESVLSGCLSMRSDRSIVEPPFFSNEPGPSGTKWQRRRNDSMEQQSSRSRTSPTSTVLSKSLQLSNVFMSENTTVVIIQ
ncbi:hypothetical protein EPR50_G00211980 [Perca flavescens]|uniref:Uncharacterized protein n=1 Tax=Perca flavescens TaxID=8167 RepID=A0A484C1U1_PERFV|nr:hypothetical protein EPR50_G00211980 [Perca flavescens]